jgi:protease-4
MKKFFTTVSVIFTICFLGGCMMMVAGVVSLFQDSDTPIKITKGSILLMELDGVITDSKKFVEDLNKYVKEDKIKGVLVVVNSPGGVVGPSQEMYNAILRVRTVNKKPIVASVSSMAASGAFYAAVAADKIVTNPGSMIGSIGVIMEFANLEKLYDWAKIKRYSIKTGAYKDSGAEYREMRSDEKKVFQDLIDNVFMQFKKAVAQGRKLPLEKVAQYADGRVFTGEQAVAMGFADQIGGYQDALALIGKMTGLGDDPKIFKPPRKHGSKFMDLIEDYSEESRSSALPFEKWSKQVFHAELFNQPLYLMPGFWRGEK